MSKLDEITERDTLQFSPPKPLRSLLERHPRARVLDWGCGRGDLVLWMRRNGWDAYGVDIDLGYIENGRRSFAGLGCDPEVLFHSSQLEDAEVEPFDLVLSYMVLEHVRDLGAAAGAIRRLVKTGGIGLHLYPGRWRPVEPHVGVPFVHWFGGSMRRRTLALCVKRGLDRRSQWGLDDATNEQIVDHFATYLDENTRYRSNREIVRTFEEAGFVSRISMDDHRLTRPQGPIPEALARAGLARFVTAHLVLDG